MNHFALKVAAGIFVVILSLLALVIGVTRIDSGTAGLVVHPNGKISPEVLSDGWHWTGFSSVRHVCSGAFGFINEDTPAKTSDGLAMKNADIDVYLTPTLSSIPGIASVHKGDFVKNEIGQCEYIGGIQIKLLLKTAINNVAQLYHSRDIHTKSADFATELRKEVTAQLKDRFQQIEATKGGTIPAFFVNDVQVRNLEVDPALTQLRRDLANQETQKMQAQNRLEIARTDAQSAIARAQGEAEAVRTMSQAMASAGGAQTLEMRRLEVIEKLGMEYAKKWNGVTPQAVTSMGAESGGVMIGVPAPSVTAKK